MLRIVIELDEDKEIARLLELRTILPPEGQALIAAHVDDEQRSPVWYAAGNGNLYFLTELIRSGFPIHIIDTTEGLSPLACACRCGSYACAILLLKARASPDGVLSDGSPMAITPLMAACAVSDKRMVDILFEYDARPDLQWAGAPIGSPRTALGFCELGCDERARQCHHVVRMYAQRREKRIETAQGRRVGSLGTSAAQRELTEMGIKQRRSPEATEEQLTITLEVAIEMDDVAYVSKWLREGGRDSVGTRCIGDNFTPLDLACFYGSYNVAQRLLKARADANEPDNMLNSNGWFPLLLAATSGSVACVEVLLDFGAIP